MHLDISCNVADSWDVLDVQPTGDRPNSSELDLLSGLTIDQVSFDKSSTARPVNSGNGIDPPVTRRVGTAYLSIDP